eukprot:9469533-Pyramimonas_sp.AAC.1
MASGRLSAMQSAIAAGLAASGATRATDRGFLGWSPRLKRLRAAVPALDLCPSARGFSHR